MRLAEDTDSWKAGGIIRRDFRHAHGDPEVNLHGSRKKKPGKKRSDHKHEYFEVGTVEYAPWYFKNCKIIYTTLECIGCPKRKSQRLVVEK